MSWESLFDPTFSTRLCLTLLHSMWQVALLGLIAWGIERFSRRSSVERSYAVHVAALVAGLAALPATFAMVDAPSRQVAVQLDLAVAGQPYVAPEVARAVPSEAERQHRAIAPAGRFEQRPGDADTPAAAVPAKPESRATMPSARSAAQNASTVWPAVAAWAVGLYAIGVLAMLVRLASGLWHAHRLASAAKLICDGPVAGMLQALARDWSMRVVPALAFAERIVVPKVVGLVRPTILLPASALTGLSRDELQMILAHELAHLRRYDLWVNLLQRLAETVLFFNPALWYLSRRVSTLREYCCDELTCRTMARTAAEPRSRYAAALIHVAELSRASACDSGTRPCSDSSELATLAAAGRSPSDLRRRVARLFGEPIREPLRLSRGSLLILLAAVALLVAAPAIWQTSSNSATARVADAAHGSAETVVETDTAADEASTSDDSDSPEEESTVPISINGRALGETGNPIAGARVFLASLATDDRRLAETTTDADGAYRFENVGLPIKKADTNEGRDVGVFQVFGIAEGYALTWESRKAVYPEVRHVSEPGPGDTVELDLTFGRPAAIRGRIVDDQSQPIADARIEIRGCETSWSRNAPGSSTVFSPLTCLNDRETVPAEVKFRTTDADGRFEFTGLPANVRWKIDVRPPGHPSRTIGAVTAAEVPSDASGRTTYSDDFELVFPRPHMVRLRVVYDDTGEPAANVGVGGNVVEAGFWKTTDDDGIVEAPLPDGQFQISLFPQYGTPYLRTKSEVVVSEETAEQTTTLRLRAAALADVTVTDAVTGEPLAGVDIWIDRQLDGVGRYHREVHAYRSWEVETNLSRYESPRTDERGHMRVLFEPGTHRIGVGLEAYPVGYEQVIPNGREIELEAGKVTTVAFQMRRTGAVAQDRASDGSAAADGATEGDVVPLDLVIAKHLMLLEGREIITWERLDEIIAALPVPSSAYPHFYFTHGVIETKLPYDAAKDQTTRLYRDFKLNRSSEGSLSLRTSFRYDRIETAADLVPDESLRVEGKVLDPDGHPVAGAEVLLVTPVDESISYKSYHIALVEGRVRNPLEHVMTHSDDAGEFVLYPPKDTRYYVIALQPDVGFAMTSEGQFTEKREVRMLAWGGLVISLRDEPEDQQASLTTRVAEISGRPEVIINQYWGDLKRPEPTLVFTYTHVPPYRETTITREFPLEHGAVSLEGASVRLLRGETRQLDLGPLSEQQRNEMEQTRDSFIRRRATAKAKTESERANGDQSASPKEAETPSPDGNADNRNQETREFELLVRGPDGEPVPNASVELRTKPAPTAEQILAGEFLRSTTSRSFVTTDTEGRLLVQLAEPPSEWIVIIRANGFGPYWASWGSAEHPEPVPLRFVAELDAAWSVGAVLVDSVGNPIEGVEVRPWVDFKNRPGDTESRLGGKSVTTDADGKWRYDAVPGDLSAVLVEIDHPDFMPIRPKLTRSTYGIQPAGSPVARIALEPGLSITGRVTDENGKPIGGATVRTKFLNDLREATTDERGEYRLIGCEPRMARVVVSAEGRAMDMQEVRVDPDMPPVNFSLKHGGKVRIRVVDEAGHGISKARIFFQSWRGERIHYFEFDHVNQYADENGVWEWNEAPLDEFEADICRPGGMQLSRQPLIARDEEYVFTPPKALVVSGSVVDAKTKEPIKRFRVVPGLRNRDPQIGMNWIPDEAFEATDGAYRVRLTHAYPAHLVRIEADGYRVAISRDLMTDEGEVAVDFALEPAENLASIVLTPDGEPAAGAKVALGVAGSQINIDNGEIDDGSTYATRLDADSSGRFSIPARDEPFQIVITHSSGFAHLKSADGPIPDRVTLTPWARVKGTFRVGAQPAPNVPLTIYSEGIHSYGDDVPNIFTSHDVTTGKDGQFVFERVAPGKGRIGRRIVLMVGEGATEVTSSQRVPTEFIAGQTTTLDLGGTGRPVVGKVAPRAGYSERVLWNFALVKVQPDIEMPPAPEAPEDIREDPDKRSAWWTAWKATEEGKAWLAAYEKYRQFLAKSIYFTASVDRNGAFRIDDMPEGDYVLSVDFNSVGARRQLPGVLRRIHFSVPPVKGSRSAEPLDLGTLVLEQP